MLHLVYKGPRSHTPHQNLGTSPRPPAAGLSLWRCDDMCRRERDCHVSRVTSQCHYFLVPPTASTFDIYCRFVEMYDRKWCIVFGPKWVWCLMVNIASDSVVCPLHFIMRVQFISLQSNKIIPHETSLCFPGYDPHRNSDFLSDFLLILLIHPPWEPEVERKLIR